MHCQCQCQMQFESSALIHLRTSARPSHGRKAAYAGSQARCNLCHLLYSLQRARGGESEREIETTIVKYTQSQRHGSTSNPAGHLLHLSQTLCQG